MADQTTPITLGIDVAKDQLVIYHWQTRQLTTLANDQQVIERWFKQFTGPVRLAIEPTSHYHLALVERADAAGHAVYLVNPRQLAHYRQAVEARNKTDPDDAWLLARYLTHEANQLRRHQPLCSSAQRLWQLLNRRATVVVSRQQIKQSLGNHLDTAALFEQFKRLLQNIDQQIRQLIEQLGWNQPYQHCLSIPGIGPLNAAALVAAFHRGVFASANAFVAFIGLDLQHRQSGVYRGQTKLSKRGAPELRRLLYCASQAARSHPRFDHYYQRQLDKGLSKTAAKVALARKIVRIAYALINKNQSFDLAMEP